MEVKAVTKRVRMSASKARDLIRKVRGMPVAQALSLAELNARKAAFEIGKTLKSAVANAEHNARLSVDDLWVKDAYIDEGPVLKRFWPRARGMAKPVLKRTCHITVVLTDGKD